MNPILRDIEPHSSKKISEYAARFPDIVDLTVGEPSFGPPAVFRRALARALGQRSAGASEEDRYAHSRGAPELRTAIADCYLREHRTRVDPDSQVLVTNGAVGAVWTAVLTATAPEDEVLLPDPCYMLYEPIITVLGRRVVRIPTVAAAGFRIEPQVVARRIGPRTRLLVLNSPANPTGTVLDRECLRRLCDLAADRGVRVLHDEVLDRFTEPDGHTSISEIAPEGVGISVNSLSKRFGMTGWRIGWLVADAEFVACAAKAHTFFHLAVGHAVQRAAAAALADRSADVEVTRHVRQTRDHGRRFVAALNQIPGLSEARPPDGGFYAFLDVHGFADRLGLGSHSPTQVSGAVADYLLHRARVAVVPGTAFGPAGAGFVRMSLASGWDRLEQAAHQIAQAGPAATADPRVVGV